MKKVILVAGIARSGKDTFADYILSKDPSFVKLTFAGALRSAVIDTFKVDPVYLHELKDEPIPNVPVEVADNSTEEIINLYKSDFINGKWTGRTLLKLYGTLARSVYPNYWIDQLVKKVNSINQNVVVSDLRYLNEYETCSSLLNAKLVVIDNGRSSKSNHASERNLDFFKNLEDSYVINNTGTIEEYYTKIDKYLELNK